MNYKETLEEILSLCVDNETSPELVGKIEKLADDALTAVPLPIADKPKNKIMKYRKKPVVVEAMLFNEESKQLVYNWVRGEQMNIDPSFDKDGKPVLIVPTLEGEMICAIGDYLIKEPFPTDWRKFYPCKPDIFEKTYEPADKPALPIREEGENEMLEAARKFYPIDETYKKAGEDLQYLKRQAFCKGWVNGKAPSTTPKEQPADNLK